MPFGPIARSSSLVVALLAAACAAPTGDGATEGAPAGDAAGATTTSVEALSNGPRAVDSYDRFGVLRTIDVNGRIDHGNPFFQDLGTNGRRCATCHIAEDAWTITPAHVQERFEETSGLDPLFRLNDGSNSPHAPVKTRAERRRAYSMLLSKALIRVGIGMPAGAEFDLVHVDDPYGFASATQLSLFRRPLPSTNLKFLSTVMWDGRETFAGQTIHFDLGDQANGATLGHAEGAQNLTAAQREAIVAFETGLFTAQILEWRVGNLRRAGAQGGPEELITQPFFLGINDPLGKNPTGAPFDADVFTIYAPWAHLRDRDRDGDERYLEEARASVARGEHLFNELPIDIVGVKGLNDDLGAPHIAGHCTTCHDTPSSGNHSVPAPLDIGLTDASRRTPDMPLYTLRNKTTHATVETTDPGRALVTGKWKDIGRFKGPILRGLAARAPYFHNGFAADFDAVIDFYDTRFNLHLARGDRRDLIAFLRTL